MSDDLVRVRTWSRREFVGAALTAAGALWLPRGGWGEEATPLSEEALSALAESPLVYVSPLRSDGSESRCHGEVWFVRASGGEDVLVVGSRDGWRARAVRRGLDQARLWVGDFGVWKRSERFRNGPSFLARASFETDVVARARALEAFGAKYSDEWGKWGPRFRNGLADGSRVLIRYQPASE
jgi:hypothetical protein